MNPDAQKKLALYESLISLHTWVSAKYCISVEFSRICKFTVVIILRTQSPPSVVRKHTLNTWRGRKPNGTNSLISPEKTFSNGKKGESKVHMAPQAASPEALCVTNTAGVQSRDVSLHNFKYYPNALLWPTPHSAGSALTSLTAHNSSRTLGVVHPVSQWTVVCHKDRY